MLQLEYIGGLESSETAEFNKIMFKNFNIVVVNVVVTLNSEQ